MSNITKPYELSIWKDEWDDQSQKYVERKIMIVGSNQMEYQGQAHDIKLLEKTSGKTTLSFMMYYTFVDSTSGEPVSNIFTEYIANETKIKLYYDNEWYDFLVKNIVEDSAKKTFTYSLVDYNVNELSKNGYHVTLNKTLMNNLGTAKELGERVLQDTDWNVESEFVAQVEEENLCILRFPTELDDFAIYQIIDDIEGKEIRSNELSIAAKKRLAGRVCYGFYSHCVIQPERFQFLFPQNAEENIEYWFYTEDDCIVQDKNVQYYIERPKYVQWPNVSNNANNELELWLPEGMSGDHAENNIEGINNNSIISQLYRGARYVFSQESRYHAGLDQYVFRYIQKDKPNNEEEIFGLIKTHYVTPNIIDNYVSNSSFSSSVGWASVDANGKVLKCESLLGRYDDNNQNIVSFIQDIFVGTDLTKVSHNSYLTVQGSKNKTFLVNSGFFDFRNKITSLTEGDKYVCKLCFYTGKINDSGIITPEPLPVGKNISIKVSNQKTDKMGQSNSQEEVVLLSDNFTITQVQNYYELVTDELKIQNTLSTEEFQLDKYRIFIEFPEFDGTFVISKCQLYRYYPNEQSTGYIDIDNQTDNITTRYWEELKYFKWKGQESSTEAQLDFLSSTDSTFVPYFTPTCEKKTQVEIQNSNYFNGIQAIAEAFQVWPRIKVDHNELGEITNKTILFQNYVGQNNLVGFKYGVNSSSLKRTVDSKAIVTKMIVAANKNELAPGGACSIALASTNVSQDNILYDFSYYIRQNLIDDPATFQKYLYDLSANGREEFENLWAMDQHGNYPELLNVPADGYFRRLRIVNDALTDVRHQIEKIEVPLSNAESNQNVGLNGKNTAEEQLLEAKSNFLRVADFGYDEIYKDEAKKDKVANSVTLMSYLQKIMTFTAEKENYTKQYNSASKTYNEYKINYDNCLGKQKRLREVKEALNKTFYRTMARYIQEGTWVSEKYVDHNLYYNDALGVLHNSCMPKVSYTFNVIDVSPLPSLEPYAYKIGDRTFIEDTEFFGYALDGSPYREQVVVTETTRVLDNPSKNTVKIQNFVNQFQDLFQRITATVQSVQYSEGGYRKAAELAEADTKHKISFLTDALNSAETAISNAGEQSVLINKEGITITDLTRPSQGLRIVSGAILLKDQDAFGNEKWATGLTANGISANLITTGQLNTGLLQIMHGDEPAFRWDVHGITAYDYDNSVDNTYLSMNTKRGVRFDRFGLYGYSGIDGETWKPTGINTGANSIEDHSTFYLTWAGLKVTKHTTDGTPTATVRIGDNAQDDSDTDVFKISKYIYDGDKRIEQPQMWITSDGDIKWNQEASPTNVAYNDEIKPKPTDNTGYLSLPDNKTNEYNGWHKIKSGSDRYGSYTYDGGITWTNPIQIEGQDGKDGKDGEDGKDGKDGTDAEVTFENMWNAFDAVGLDTEGNPISGLHTFDLNGTKYLGINADLIRTGSIRVGGTATDGSDSKFYADMGVDSSVYIAGWKVHEGYISKGDIGSSGSVFLCSTPYEQYGIHGADDTEENPTKWLLSLGEHFGVDEDGAIYATKGKIGPLDIGDFGALSPNVGNNLVKDSSMSNQSQYWYAQDLKQTYTDGFLTLYKTSLALGQLYQQGQPGLYLSGGETYTLSAEVKKFSNYATTGIVLQIQLESQQKGEFVYSLDLSDITDEWKKVHTTFTVDAPDWVQWDGQQPPTLILKMYEGTKSGICIRNIKLETGSIATMWCPSTEDAMAPSVSGDYSWKFSSTTGMYMYNGGTNTTPVLKVDANGLSLNGSLSATYLYAGEEKEGYIFKAGNNNAPKRSVYARILMSAPKESGYTTDGTSYKSTGRIPEGYDYNTNDLQSPGWTIRVENNIVTATKMTTDEKIPPVPVIYITLTEKVARPYGIKISSNNDITVPILNSAGTEYEDIDLTSLILQLSAQT